MAWRQYACYYYKWDKATKKFVLNQNSARWKGIELWFHNEKYIYIDVTRSNEQILNAMLPLINKITYCKRHNSKTLAKPLVKYELIGTDYYKNLLLLNFIRYSWDCVFNDTSKSGELSAFQTKFLEVLLSTKDDDPILVLTTANSRACDIAKGGYDPNGDHSNAYKNAKIRTLKEFNEHHFTSVSSFLHP